MTYIIGDYRRFTLPLLFSVIQKRFKSRKYRPLEQHVMRAENVRLHKRYKNTTSAFVLHMNYLEFIFSIRLWMSYVTLCDK